ncbi:DNA gyrase subunit A [Ruaniaceae bacterium KH17]|nr:DNA gyrase subunit A [Ruaniaceae bacterium KH17]
MDTPILWHVIAGMREAEVSPWRYRGSAPHTGDNGRVPTENIVEVDVSTEMEGSFLEYAYSVIYSRALPDARDGLKPVQRRILFQMDKMGLAPTKPHVKSARVVGDVMGRLHPHGDAAIYDALVRMAQPFSLRLPLVDGHGNFGSPDDGPAASRYTEARLAPAALEMTRSLDEDVVDFVPNYDNTYQQPSVLPAAIPNLLVNGASGIAVGMATNMAPHNLVEVVAAARHLLANPNATVEDLIRFVPGPDLPTGGKIVGLQGVRDAYATGRGTFKMRAKARIENVTARKKAIVVTELPYQVGPERVIEKIRDAVNAKKVQGLTAVNDLSDRENGLRIVIEVKNSFNPEAVLESLYRFTPLEESFGINNVALVEGQPQTLGLKRLLEVYVEHRLAVVTRRTRHRLDSSEARLHLVEGLLIAILDIDEVIQVIRTSDNAEAARQRLMGVFDLSELQAEYILELRLRRLTKFSRIELESERDELTARIAELREILASDARLREVVSTELAEVAGKYGTSRRTVLLESSGATATAAKEPMEIPDGPCHVVLTGTGLIARVDGELGEGGPRRAHDAFTSTVPGTVHGEIGVITSAGRLLRLGVLDIPALAPVEGRPGVDGGHPIEEMVNLERGEEAVALMGLDSARPIVLATAQGVVKRVTSADFPQRDEFEVIALKDGDYVVGAAPNPNEDDRIILISAHAQLLHFAASNVRPQGRAAGGMAGIKLRDADRVIQVAVVPAELVSAARVVTIAGPSNALPGTVPGSAKVTPLDRYPGKGRATGGVRCHKFLKGEDALFLAWAGLDPRAVGAGGNAVELPEEDERYAGSGRTLKGLVVAIG